MDWTIANRKDVITVQMVDPHSLDRVIGLLEGVYLPGTSVTEGYYTDTRVSAKVSTVGDDGYVSDAWLRIVHSVPDEGYSEELFCGPVTDASSDDESGVTKTKYSLDSNLYTIKDDLLVNGFSIGRGGRLKMAVDQLLSMCGRERDLSKMQDKVIQAPVMYERGDSALSDLFDMCDGTNRVSVDGHGRVTVSKYTAPSAIGPILDIDPLDPRSVVVGSVSHSDSSRKTPGRVIYKSGSGDKERVGSYDAPASAASSSARRGYMVAKMETASGTDDPSVSQLNAMARRSWQASQDAGREHEMTVIWQALHQGDVVRYRHDGEWVKCLVKSVESDLGAMRQRLTLKEV